jgi:hypothetical protein
MTQFSEDLKQACESYRRQLEEAARRTLSHLSFEERAERLYDSVQETFAHHRTLRQRSREHAHTIVPEDDAALRRLVLDVLEVETRFWTTLAVLAELALEHFTSLARDHDETLQSPEDGSAEAADVVVAFRERRTRQVIVGDPWEQHADLQRRLRLGPKLGGWLDAGFVDRSTGEFLTRGQAARRFPGEAGQHRGHGVADSADFTRIRRARRRRTVPER